MDGGASTWSYPREIAATAYGLNVPCGHPSIQLSAVKEHLSAMPHDYASREGASNIFLTHYSAYGSVHVVNDISTKCRQMQSRVASNNEFMAHSCRLHAEQATKDAAFARKIREQTGMSLREVAKIIGFSAAHMSDLERGRRNWTRDTLEKWQKALARKPEPKGRKS
jgi:DNA-binding transcriptional regulator YiaG